MAENFHGYPIWNSIFCPWSPCTTSQLPRVSYSQEHCNVSNGYSHITSQCYYRVTSASKKIYNSDPPTTYKAFKKAVIKFDELEQEFAGIHWAVNANLSRSHPHQPPHQSSKPSGHAGDRKDATGTTFGGPGRPMDTSVAEQERKKKEYKAQQQDQATKGLCYNCGKPGHLKCNCPNWKG